MRIDLETLSCELKELNTAVHGVQDTMLQKNRCSCGRTTTLVYRSESIIIVRREK